MKILLLLLIFLLPISILAQDTIITIKGKEIVASIEMISNGEIHYKKYDNPDGPKYIMNLTEAFLIKLNTGVKYVYPNHLDSTQTQLSTPQSDYEWYLLGSKDAEMFHKGNETLAIVAIATAILPPVGIPILIYHVVEKPKVKPSKLPIPEYAENEKYLQGYQDKAFEINKAKAGQGFLLGLVPFIGISILYLLAFWGG